ncbi:SAM-dependent methyltransferase [Pseudonocardia hispaniensis]|uniref:SAM-dependent methyltransferase n=1 Tax=Pseudonocardia hispaniensis TaxID=904933 RepID=A0ABW1IYK7_9PSEU
MDGDRPRLHRRSPVFQPCPRVLRRRYRGTLIGLGVGQGESDRPAAGLDHLADADVVFASCAAETTVLFYAEAWRVEQIGGRLGRRIAEWFAAHPGGTAVFATLGDPAQHRPLHALARRLPGVRVEHVPGVTILPPPRRPLPRLPGPSLRRTAE